MPEETTKPAEEQDPNRDLTLPAPSIVTAEQSERALANQQSRRTLLGDREYAQEQADLVKQRETPEGERNDAVAGGNAHEARDNFIRGEKRAGREVPEELSDAAADLDARDKETQQAAEKAQAELAKSVADAADSAAKPTSGELAEDNSNTRITTPQSPGSPQGSSVSGGIETPSDTSTAPSGFSTPAAPAVPSGGATSSGSES